MRMWKVDPTKMCRKHLLGEHVEMHMFVGTILKGVSLTGYVSRGLVEVTNIHQRHDQLVAEMDARGYKHKSVLATYPDAAIEKYVSGYEINIAANEVELRRRCKECKF